MKNIIFTTLLFLGYMNFGLCQNIIDTIYFDDGGIDSYTKSTDASTNFGTDTSLRVFWDYGSPSINNYSYLKANFSSIPESAIVSDASIHLYAVEVNNGADHAMLLQRVSTSWTETGITWTSSPTVTGTSVTMTNAATSELGWQSYNMTEIVRYQITNPAQNYGYRIALSAQSGTIDKGAIYASTENSNSTIRPYVIVEYYIPPHDTIYFQSSKDAKVYSGSTTTNYGQDSLLAVDWTYDSAGTASRTFLYADLSHIPKNSLISTADIHVNALSVNNSASHPMYVEGVNTTPWYEDTITWSNQPTVWSSYRSGIPDASTSSVGWHEMSIISLAKYAVWLPEKNYGWRIALQSESDTVSKGVIYASSEHDSVELRPYFVIEYLPPIEIEAYVSHCTEGNDDGSIEVASIIGGCELYTSYYWRKLSGGSLTAVETGTDLSLMDVSGLSDGLYMLEITDYRSQTGYKYFFVGEENVTTSVEFAQTNSINRAKYTEDSWLIYYQTGDSSLVGGSVTSFSCHTNTTYDSRGLLQYQVDWDPSLNFTACDQAVSNKGGCFQTATSDNDAWISRVTEPWGEFYATWGTRPDLTTQDRVYVPTTVTNGNENRNDTFDILAFIPYWQENPGENYGIDLGLNSYDQPAAASRDYNSSDQGAINLMVSFTARPRIETNFVDSTGLGSILVNAPAGALPFKYLISYNELPILDTIWFAIKDSLPSDIDSMAFYRGQTNTRNYTFTDLKNDHYFIGVYDNNGVKILSEEVFLSPEFAVFDSTDLDVDGDTLLVKAGETSATATMFAALPVNEAGGFEIEVVTLDDDLVIGFDNINDAFPTYNRDYLYSLEIQTSGKVYAHLGDSILDSTTVSVGNNLKMYKDEFDVMYFYKNGIEFASDTLSDTLIYDFKVQVQLKGQDAKALFLVQSMGLKKPKLTYTLDQIICGEENKGSITITISNSYFGITIDDYVIKDQSLTTVASGSTSGTEVLPPGIYTLTYHYSIGSVSYAFTEQFIIGYKIWWTNLNNITEIPGTFNSITPTNLANYATANSFNATDPLENNWVQFSTQGKSLSYSTAYETVQLENSTGDYPIKLVIMEPGGGIISKFVLVYSESSFDSWFIAGAAPFRIEMADNGDVELFYNNVSQTTFPSSVAGKLKFDILEYKKVYIDYSISSFCYPINGFVAKTKPVKDGSYFITKNDLLKFQYTGEYNQSNLIYELTDETGAVVSTLDYTLNITGVPTDETKKNADNRYTIDMESLAAGYYLLTITNVKGETHFIRIKN